MIHILMILLGIVFVCNISLNKCLGAPAVLFSFSFFFSSIWASAYADKWQLEIHDYTLFVVLGSVIAFSLNCLVTKTVNRKRVVDNSIDIEAMPQMEIELWKIIIYIFFEILIVYIYMKIIRNGTGNEYLSKAIYSVYSQQSELNIPLYFRILLAFLRGGGYWFSYLFVYNYISKKKIQWLYLIIIIISIISTLLTGSRGTGICILLSIFAFYLIFIYRNIKDSRSIKIKNILFLIFVGIVVLWGFPKVNILLGRITKTTTLDYLATYVGAEINNLDLFLTHNDVPKNTGTWGSMTFYSIESTLGRYLGLNVVRDAYAHPFLFANGYFLGNVYTMFYELLYDFGYVGNFVVVLLYSYVCQKIFDKAVSVKISQRVSLSILLYAYIFPLIVISFFAWWIGNYVISTSFIYIVFSWIMYNFFFLKVKFRFKRRK